MSFVVEDAAVAVGAPGFDRFEILGDGLVEFADCWLVEVVVEALAQLIGIIDAKAYNTLPPQRIRKVNTTRRPFNLLVLSHLKLHLLVRTTAQTKVAERLQLCRVFHVDCHSLDLGDVDVASGHRVEDGLV